MSAKIENYCIACKQVARDDCEERGHVVGTLGQVTPPPPEQPAPEDGEWEYVEDGYGRPRIRVGKIELTPQWKGLATASEVRAVLQQAVTDHARAALVPGLVSALREVLGIVRDEGHAGNYVPDVEAAEAALAATREAGIE